MSLDRSRVAEFEIEARGIVADAGLVNSPTATAYASSPDSVGRLSILVGFETIEPPIRDEGVPTFPRAHEIVAAIQRGSPLPPVEVERLPPGSPYAYQLLDGFHRFYLLRALGFRSIAAVEGSQFVFEVP